MADFNIAWIIGGVIGGLLIALIVTGSWKSQLKTVYRAAYAGNYVREGSLNITRRTERFLYKKVERIAKPKANTPSGQQGGGSSAAPQAPGPRPGQRPPAGGTRH